MTVADSTAASMQLDEQYMRRAIELAARALETTDPNPRVGCVLVREQRVVGEGWHQRAGEPHAEVHALRMAGEAARGATAYVTLEPCAHHGRTPPCSQALIQAGVSRVVYASDDPDPRVSGAGAAELRAAGIQTQSGVLAAAARELNPGYLKRLQHGLPWLRLKLAASLDGRTALANGESRWITGEAARHDVQLWRARSSAIVSSSGTVLADDPALNVRLAHASRQPLRVVLDSQLRVPSQARVYDSPGQSMVFTASTDAAKRAALQQRGVRIESAEPERAGGLMLEPVLRRLAQLQMNELWVEAGAKLAGALLQAQLVDELLVYLAPSALGPSARPLIDWPELTQLQQRLRLKFTHAAMVGEDLRLTAVPLGGAEPSN